MQTDDVFLVIGPAKSTRLDFAAFARRRTHCRIVVVSPSTLHRRLPEGVDFLSPERLSQADFQGGRLGGVIVFLGSSLTAQDNALLTAIAQTMTRTNSKKLIVISTFSAHQEDRRAGHVERQALAPFQNLPARTVIFRPGPVLSPTAPTTATLRTLGCCWPLVPAHLNSCFLDSDELFAAIFQELGHSTAASRTYAMPGPRRAWRALLRQYGHTGPLQRLLTLMLLLPGLLGLGHLLYFLMAGVATLTRRPWLGGPDILYPKSPRELLMLYNKYSYSHVKIVGYNNGVRHFGHRYPGKTLVSTIHCSRIAWIKGQRMKLDAGTTVKKAVDWLAQAGKELYVVPNYSYVSVGTSFFVPIHGSASDFCTMAETIDRVLLYDPVEDRLVRAKRNSPAFQHYLYNLERDVLLLRLVLRVKDKSAYYRKHTRITAPTSDEIIDCLTDSRPSNVEIRKARAGEDAIDVYQYYKEPLPGDTEVLAFPRDSLGQLWDRLESNRLTAALFHGLVRRFAFHVELFIPLDEFAGFWTTHASLPIAKIQLRYIKRDGYLHSPFAKHDCISADLFMLKKHKPAFEKYVQTNFRGVSFNPGKHST
jgi:hypothetical protein